MRVEWSDHAVADLKAISEYIERNRNLETANRVTRTIYDAVQSLRSLRASMDCHLPSSLGACSSSKYSARRTEMALRNVLTA
jgi:plasmid stabilization system protein ParE